MKPGSVLSRPIIFPYSAIDARHRPKLPHILHLFQDMASEHAACLNVSGLDLDKKNYKWVISKYHIRISGQISWMDQLIINTWRTPYKNLYEIRQFEMRDHSGKIIITAMGIWVMIKKETLKPVRLDRFMTGKMLVCDPAAKFNLPVIECPDQADIEKKFDIEYQDIDLNQHVNNTVYLRWALESIPLEMMETYYPLQVDMAFHQESSYGQKILSRVKISNHGIDRISYHRILDSKNLALLSVAQIKWARPADK